LYDWENLKSAWLTINKLQWWAPVLAFLCWEHTNNAAAKDTWSNIKRNQWWLAAYHTPFILYMHNHLCRADAWECQSTWVTSLWMDCSITLPEASRWLHAFALHTPSIVTHGDGKTYTAEVSAFKRMSSSMHCVQGESCDASMAGSVLLSHCQDRNCKLNDLLSYYYYWYYSYYWYWLLLLIWLLSLLLLIITLLLFSAVAVAVAAAAAAAVAVAVAVIVIVIVIVIIDYYCESASYQESE